MNQQTLIKSQASSINLQREGAIILGCLQMWWQAYIEVSEDRHRPSGVLSSVFTCNTPIFNTVSQQPTRLMSLVCPRLLLTRASRSQATFRTTLCKLLWDTSNCPRWALHYQWTKLKFYAGYKSLGVSMAYTVITLLVINFCAWQLQCRSLNCIWFSLCSWPKLWLYLPFWTNLVKNNLAL